MYIYRTEHIYIYIYTEQKSIYIYMYIYRIEINILLSSLVLHTYLFTLSEWTFLLTISWAWWQFMKGLQHYEQILCVIRLPTGKNETLFTKGVDSLWRALQPVNQITFLCTRHVFKCRGWNPGLQFVWRDEDMTKRWWQWKWHLEEKNNRTHYLKQERQSGAFSRLIIFYIIMNVFLYHYQDYRNLKGDIYIVLQVLGILRCTLT